MNPSAITGAKARLKNFVDLCRTDDSYRLTPRADPSPYALCFAIFVLHLVGEKFKEPDAVANTLRKNIRDRFRRASSPADLSIEKPFLQLLCFTLSALDTLNELKNDPLDDIVSAVMPHDIKNYLERTHALKGKAGSGNLAMFSAILLLHTQNFLGRSTTSSIEKWVELHLKTMNKFGFWGDSRSMSFLQFQNGYHQYEIFEYLGIKNPKLQAAAGSVAQLADKDGHFAPYPGGGGCYDYDAVFILSSVNEYQSLLEKTSTRILQEQNIDGGFCESRDVRPRHLLKTAMHLARPLPLAARRESLRYCLTLQRPKHDRISTHWSRYSREWSESDLWDSWFRMLAIARSSVALEKSAVTDWGFLKYPGIGFVRHP